MTEKLYDKLRKNENITQIGKLIALNFDSENSLCKRYILSVKNYKILKCITFKEYTINNIYIIDITFIFRVNLKIKFSNINLDSVENFIINKYKKLEIINNIFSNKILNNFIVIDDDKTNYNHFYFYCKLGFKRLEIILSEHDNNHVVIIDDTIRLLFEDEILDRIINKAQEFLFNIFKDFPYPLEGIYFCDEVLFKINNKFFNEISINFDQNCLYYLNKKKSFDLSFDNILKNPKILYRIIIELSTETYKENIKNIVSEYKDVEYHDSYLKINLGKNNKIKHINIEYNSTDCNTVIITYINNNNDKYDVDFFVNVNDIKNIIEKNIKSNIIIEYDDIGDENYVINIKGKENLVGLLQKLNS